MKNPGRCCIPSGSHHQHTRRSSSNSCAADQPTTPAQTPEPAAAARPDQTDKPPTRNAHPTSPATGRALRCAPRPPQDRLTSTQPRMITRWPSCVRDRHAARSRSTAGVLGLALDAARRVRRGYCHQAQERGRCGDVLRGAGVGARHRVWKLGFAVRSIRMTNESAAATHTLADVETARPNLATAAQVKIMMLRAVSWEWFGSRDTGKRVRGRVGGEARPEHRADVCRPLVTVAWPI